MNKDMPAYNQICTNLAKFIFNDFLTIIVCGTKVYHKFTEVKPSKQTL